MSELPFLLTSQSNWKSFELLQAIIDTFPDPIFVKDLQHRWIACNQAFCTIIGQPYDTLIGRSDPDFWPAEQAEVFWRLDDEVFTSGEFRGNEEGITVPDGSLHTIWTRKYPLRDAEGQVVGLCGIITDITDIKHRRDELQLLETEISDKKAIIEAQAALLDQLSVPVIQVWESVLLLPLIGVLDSRRAAQVLESMLESIAANSARILIVDITGVPVVDTSVAGYLIRAVQAAQLLGCQTLLVGISPEIAQTLVGLGVDFSRITTRATLQSGLEYAFSHRNAIANPLEKLRV
ncbi:MAG TPA: PAS domain-containing protein [Roseiflexaceae bacterium]|nr:PAS domain-containing protein [Roseiflexaceae bacterium]